MKGRFLVIFLSIITAVVFMSGGYGLWEKTLIIKGTITVVEPTQVTAPKMEITPWGIGTPVQEISVSPEATSISSEDSNESSDQSVDNSQESLADGSARESEKDTAQTN